MKNPFSLAVLLFLHGQCYDPCLWFDGGCSDGADMVPLPDLRPSLKERRYNIDAAVSTSLPTTTSPTGTAAYQTHASFDFDAMTYRDAVVSWRGRIAMPTAISNAVYGLDLEGPAWPNLGAGQLCTAPSGKLGDLVVDARPGKGNVICVEPLMHLEIVDNTGMLVYERPTASPLPPPRFGEPMAAGSSYTLSSGVYEVTVRLLIKGTVVFNVDVFRLGVVEVTSD